MDLVDSPKAAILGNGFEPCCCRRLSTSPRNDICTGSRKLQWVVGPATTCCCFLMVMLLTTAGTAGVEAAAGFGRWAKANPLRKSSASARHNGGSGDDHDLPFPGAVPPEEIFLQLELEQLEEQVEQLGFEVLAAEVGEKKRLEILRGVERGCAIGAQMTLLMGGGALLVRLLPVFLGRDVDDEADEGSASYLLHRGEELQQALPAAKRQGLLTEGDEHAEDGQATDEGGRVPQNHAVMVTSEAGNGEEGEDGPAGEVVAFNRRRAIVRKARRISRPLLTAMAIPLALLGLARLVLGDILAETIKPMEELLFGDDIATLYSEKMPEPPRDALPFALDSEYVPGRIKMKGKRVQRPPRPMGEEEEEQVPGDNGLFDVEAEDSYKHRHCKRG